jgi:hypothetical protein
MGFREFITQQDKLSSSNREVYAQLDEAYTKEEIEKTLSSLGKKFTIHRFGRLKDKTYFEFNILLDTKAEAEAYVQKIINLFKKDFKGKLKQMKLEDGVYTHIQAKHMTDDSVELPHQLFMGFEEK